MNTRTHQHSIAAVSLFALLIAAQAQAGATANQVRQIVRQANQPVRGNCPQPCPQPGPQPGPVTDPWPGHTPRPSSYFLGVYTSTVPVDQGGSFPDGPQVQVVPGYGHQVYGQRVNQIVPQSPAYHAGLEQGDIILNANGYAMDTREHLQAAIDESQGYLEMQVRDRRTGQIVWVVAETDNRNSGPMAATSRKQDPQNASSSPTRRAQRTNPTTPSVQNNGSSSSRAASSTSGTMLKNRIQTTPSNQTLGSRRAPIRRR